MSQKNTATSTPESQFDGRPSIKEAVSSGLQYMLTIFAGNIVSMILVASVASLSVQNVNMLLQRYMLGAATSTAVQLYPIRIKSTQISSGLPCMMGLTYVFLPVCLSVAGSKGIPCIFGAQITAGVIAISHGTFLKKMSSFFPLVVTGTIVMTVSTSIFNLAAGNTAGGTSSPDFGTPINQAVGVFVVLVTLGFNVFGKGLLKATAILVGMVAGYILSAILGLVSFSGIGEVAWFAVPKPFAFGIKFDLGYILMPVLLYFIVTIQVTGDFNASCMGGPDCESTPDKVGGRATADGIISIISAVLSSFPAAAYSQSFGIVVLTKVCSHFVTPIGCGVPFPTGLCSKAGTVLSIALNCVIGGGTMVVLAMIATSGMELLAKAGYPNRNCLIIGVPLASGLGTQFCKDVSAQFPAGIIVVLKESSAILTSLLATTLSLVFPKDSVVAAEKEGKA